PARVPLAADDLAFPETAQEDRLGKLLQARLPRQRRERRQFRVEVLGYLGIRVSRYEIGLRGDDFGHGASPRGKKARLASAATTPEDNARRPINATLRADPSKSRSHPGTGDPHPGGGRKRKAWTRKAGLGWKPSNRNGARGTARNPRKLLVGRRARKSPPGWPS